jgi:hypothetical protein
MTDAFQQAAAAAAAQNTSTTAHVSRDIPAGKLADMEDPFATSSDIKSGGVWTPRVPFEEIEGRMVVMVPKSFDPKAKNPFPGGEVEREEFRVDLVVLDGDPFTYEYTERNQDDPTGPRIEKEMRVDSFPFTALSQTVAQGGLIKKLKPIFEDGRLFMGVMAYAPYAADAKNGATIDSTTRIVKAWIEKGRKGTKPQYTWALDDRASVLTPERRALAVAWWNEYRKTL